jgi:hypothetical protein
MLAAGDQVITLHEFRDESDMSRGHPGPNCELVIRMNRIHIARPWLLVLCGLALAACQNDSDDVGGDGAVHSKPKSAGAMASAGEPSAPITFDYEIMGTPVVGIPLSINVKVSSALDQPIRMHYRINDATSLLFADPQAESVSLVPIGGDAFSSEQVTVIPQREGRLFLNISAEIETDAGRMSRVMAIPIQVGSVRATPKVDGDLTTRESGEAKMSMPAKED